MIQSLKYSLSNTTLAYLFLGLMAIIIFGAIISFSEKDNNFGEICLRGVLYYTDSKFSPSFAVPALKTDGTVILCVSSSR